MCGMIGMYQFASGLHHQHVGFSSKMSFCCSFRGMNEIHLGSHVQTTKGVSDERSTLVSAHPSQRYKRREEHTCEVCILSNVIVGDGNPKTREKCFDLG